jgi:hypothetical protein
VSAVADGLPGASGADPEQAEQQGANMIPITYDDSTPASSPTSSSAARRLERRYEQITATERSVAGWDDMLAHWQQQWDAAKIGCGEGKARDQKKLDELLAGLPHLEHAAAEEARLAILTNAEAQLAELRAVDEAERARRAKIKRLAAQVAAINAGATS